MTDSENFAAILEQVGEIEGVETVWFGSTSPHDFTAQSYPLVWIRPTTWTQSEETDPPEPLRTVQFELRISARGQGGLETFTAIDSIGEQLVEQLQHQGYGGVIPGLSDLTRGRWESSHRVEELVIEGSFAYLRDDPTAP